MAMRVASFADLKLAEQIATPEVLTPLVPRIGEIAEGAAMMRSMQQEISTLGRFTRATGFSPGRDLQRVAYIPGSVRAALNIIDPEILTDRKKFYEYLAGPLKAYDLRGKVVL